MCSRYEIPEAFWMFPDQVLRHKLIIPPELQREMWPYYQGPFVRRPDGYGSGDEAVPPVELIVGRWGMIAPHTPASKFTEATKLSTFNARDDRVRTAYTFRNAWAKGQHCIVPARAFWEPDWRSGRHVPTRFTAADGDVLGIAGLWDRYKDETGTWRESYTMMTTDANVHPLLRNFHKPSSDKRMLVLLLQAQFAEWLNAPAERAMDFVTQYPADRLATTAQPLPEKPGRASKPAKADPAPEVQPDLF